MTAKTIFSLIFCACFSFGIPAMEALGEANKPIRLKRKAEAEVAYERKPKRQFINWQKTSNIETLHPKVDRSILKFGNLIRPLQWPQAIEMYRANKKISRKDPANPFGVSLIGGKDACFALHPGKVILGQGQRGKVKLAQVLYLRPNRYSASLVKPIKVGDWVAIKIQEEEFEEDEIEGLFLTKKFLIASPFKYAGKDRGARFACPLRLIKGITLREQLLKKDPEKKWGLKNFIKLAGRLNLALTKQIHHNTMSFHDKSLENMIGDTFIDFGNVFLFDSEDRNFYQSSDEDYILMLAAIFEHLFEFDYDATLQNNFWIWAYERTLDYFTEHKNRDLIIEESAFDVLANFAQCLPPFLANFNGGDENEEDWHADDQQICELIDNYLAKLGVPYIEAYK